MKKLIGTSEFSKNVLTLVSGTGIAQVITILASPVLTRLFTPAEFASFALFISFAGILSVIACGRFELAIVLPKEDKEAWSLVVLSILIALCISILTLLGVLVYDYWLVKYWPTQNFNSWFYLLPPTVLFLGTYQALNYWSTRKKTFVVNAIGKISGAAVTSGVSVFFGMMKFVPGLIIGFVAGQFVALMSLLLFILVGKNTLEHRSERVSLKQSFKRYSEFAKVNTPHALVDSLQNNGVVFLLAYYFTEALVGLFGFAFKVLRAPLVLIGAAFYQVFYQQISQQKNNHNYVLALTLKSYKRMFLLGILPFVLLTFFAPVIFAFVFGEDWREAGVIAQLLSPWLFLNFLASPVSCIPLVFNKQKQAFLITGVDVIARFSLLIYGGVMRDYHFAFVLMSVFGCLLMLFTLYWYVSIIKNDKAKQELIAVQE